MAAPRIAKISGTFSWSNGDLFNGFLVLALVFPTSGGAAWPEITVEPNQSRQRIPVWITIPIKDGVANQQCGVFYNADIDPPNTKYASYYYDTSLKSVASPSSSSDFFTVSADPTTPTTYTLTVPTAGTAVPSPTG